MTYNPNIHHRRSIRLKGYDYSQAGLYFITFCVQDRKCLFGEIVNAEMILYDAGRMVENEWLKIPQRFANVHLHEFVVMPNHFHAIIQIVQTVAATLVVASNNSIIDENANNLNSKNELIDYVRGQPQWIAATPAPAPTNKSKTIGDITGAFKSITTVEYIRAVKQNGWPTFNGKLWERNYYEIIIRNERSFLRIADYIRNNPKKWDAEKFNRK